jgi:peptide/nickel transport system substrate-binding protein
VTAHRGLELAAAAGFLLAACGPGGPGGPAADRAARPSSELRIAIGVDPDTLDPMRQTTTTVGNIVQMVAEALVTVDQDGRFRPGLATEWQEAPDAMSWTLALRAGVRFSDGTPFDAGAAKVSIDRTLSGVCPLCGMLTGSIGTVDVVDASHLRLSMARPLATGALLGLLSEPSLGIVSPRSILPGTSGYVRQERPVGTGPYLLGERVAGDRLTLVRNDRYWGRRPAYARQVFEVVPDAVTREALVRSGQAQVALLPPVSDLPSMAKDSTVKVLLAPGDRSVFIALDTVDRQQPLLRNPTVRQALNYAVNRASIVSSTLFGAAEPATSAVAPSVFGYCAQRPYGYDPDRARSMLQQAGASGLSISLIAPTGRYIQDFQAARNVASELRAVGVDVRGPSTMDWPTYVSTIHVPPAEASVDAHLLGFAPGFLDASQAMEQFDPGEIPPKGLATTYYDNPAVTGLLAKAQAERYPDARAQEYCDAQTLVWNDAPWIFLWVQRFPIVQSAQVAGVGSIPTESFTTVYAHPA